MKRVTVILTKSQYDEVYLAVNYQIRLLAKLQPLTKTQEKYLAFLQRLMEDLRKSRDLVTN